MISTRKESDEVLYPNERRVTITALDITELKKLAMTNPRHRVRICTHMDPGNLLHEMFIVHTKDYYVRPHKHIGKTESISIVEGEVDLVLFHDDGSILDVINLGDKNSGKVFYNRLAEPIFHTLLIKTDFLVFHEITNGPFKREDMVFPEWAPADDSCQVSTFVDDLLIKLT